MMQSSSASLWMVKIVTNTIPSSLLKSTESVLHKIFSSIGLILIERNFLRGRFGTEVISCFLLIVFKKVMVH